MWMQIREEIAKSVAHGWERDTSQAIAIFFIVSLLAQY